MSYDSKAVPERSMVNKPLTEEHSPVSGSNSHGTNVKKAIGEHKGGHVGFPTLPTSGFSKPAAEVGFGHGKTKGE